MMPSKETLQPCCCLGLVICSILVAPHVSCSWLDAVDPKDRKIHGQTAGFAALEDDPFLFFETATQHPLGSAPTSPMTGVVMLM